MVEIGNKKDAVPNDKKPRPKARRIVGATTQRTTMANAARFWTY